MHHQVQILISDTIELARDEELLEGTEFLRSIVRLQAGIGGDYKVDAYNITKFVPKGECEPSFRFLGNLIVRDLDLGATLQLAGGAVQLKLTPTSRRSK